MFTGCVAKPAGADCKPDTCEPACEQALCSKPFQCQNRAPCPGEDKSAFRCYGP
jgi:hypothetical protein